MNQRHIDRQAATALASLREVIDAVAEGRPADNTLGRLFRDHREWGSRDRRFISAIVYSYFRWRGWLEGIELPRAAALAYSLDAIEPNDAQTALAGKEVPAWGALPLTEKMSAVTAEIVRTLTVEMLVPAWLPAAIPDADANRLIESFQRRPPTWIRPLRGNEEKVFAALTATGIPTRRDDRIAGAIACDGNMNLIEIRRAIGNVFEVQDIASQAVGFICDPKPGQRWLDVCAGAGGKSLHLADLMNNRGEVIATDVRATALEELAERAAKSWRTCIRTLKPGAYVEGLFDGALVDAPCSGIGTWSRNPDMRWRTGETAVAEKAALQIEILDRAADSVKAGGTLVFAVCTISRAETTDIVTKFLEWRRDFAHEATQCLLPEYGPGDGMFIEKFRRK